MSFLDPSLSNVKIVARRVRAPHFRDLGASSKLRAADRVKKGNVLSFDFDNVALERKQEEASQRLHGRQSKAETSAARAFWFFVLHPIKP